jgi:MFS family permease
MGMVCPALLLLFVLKGEERERAGLMREVGIIRTMVAEMVPEKELQPRAFSIMPLVWSLGSIFGPSLGGFFAKPAENLSAVFGGNKFLIAFPFVLPNIISSVLFLLGILTGILFLHVSPLYPSRPHAYPKRKH